MATDLTGEGLVTIYNGVTFDPATSETVELSGTPVYDRAGRTVIYVVYKFKIKGYVTNASPNGYTDSQVATIRAALMRSGGEFTYQNHGFGNLTINTGAGSMRDVVWGPKPTGLKFIQYGPGKTCQVVWDVEVAIPDCDGAKYAFFPMAFNYSLGFKIDQAGYTTRTYKGYLQIPQTRFGVRNNAVHDVADGKYRSMIVPRIFPGAKRIDRDFNVSEDKCRLDFVIVDQDIPRQALPPNVVNARARHSISTSDAGMMSWVGEMQETIELSRDVSKSQAYGIFFSRFRDRLERGRLFSRMDIDGREKEGHIFITSFSVVDSDIYGREAAEFKLTYHLATKPEYILSASGLWQPMRDGQGQPDTWLKWAKSMDDTFVNNPFGLSGLVATPNQDAIVDLCAGTYAITTEDARFPPGPPPPPMPQFFQVAPPTPDNSFLHYELWCEVKDDPGAIKSKPLPPQPIMKPNPAPTGPGLGMGGGGSKYDPGPPQRNGGSPMNPQMPIPPVMAEHMLLPDTGPLAVKTQYRGAPKFEVYLCGKALRVGFPIAPPKVLALGGERAFNDHDDSCFEFCYPTCNIGFPVFAAAWRKKFFTLTYPKRPIFLPSRPDVTVNDIDRGR